MRPLLLLGWISLLAACQTLADVRPGDGRKSTITGKSYDAIWAAAHTVAEEHFEIREQDQARGIILAERTMSAWSSGAYVGIYITPTTMAPAHTIEVVRRRKVTTQAGEQDWEYKVLRDIYRRLGLPALDPRRDP